MKRLNPRAVISRKKLGDALVSLLLERDYETPSITAVRKRSKVAHATFYRHYDTLDELLTDALMTTMQDLAEFLREQETIYDETVAMFKFIKEHQDRFRVYVGLPETHPIREILKAEAVKIVIERWEARVTSPVPMDMSVNHLVESSYTFIRWHLNHINDHTPEELADFYDDLILAGATFKQNQVTEDGGALKTAGGIATINKSAFAENTADEGGAIESSETTLEITNSTFSSNSAREGGGLSSFSSFVTLTHKTWAYNSAEEQGGGIDKIGWTGSFKIRNTLITDSASGGDCHSGPNPNTLIEFTGNFIQDGSCTPQPAESQAAPSDSVVGQAQAQQAIAVAQDATGSSDVMINELTANPPHHPLQWGSPAIDAADPAYCLLDDQPDTARPQYGNCDIGAYEYPKRPDPPAQPPQPDEADAPEPPDDDPTPAPSPPAPEVPTLTPTPAPYICIVNGRIIVRSPCDDMHCAEIDVITLDKHPALQGMRFAMRLWRSTGECTHIVAQGDNLYRLAIQYDTAVEVLWRHNNLTTNELAVGQQQLLPSCTSGAVSLAQGAEVCFTTPGGLAFIDTTSSERTVHALEAYVSDGMTCAMIGQPGLVVQVASGSS